MNNAVFGKAMENVRKQRPDKKGYLVSEPHYHKIKWFRKFISN